MRALIIGQAPSQNGDPGRPLLDGSTGNRLRSLLGVSIDEYTELFERVNLLQEFPGKSGKGDAFPIESARQRAAELTSTLRRRTVLLIGGNVARAFGINSDYLKWTFQNGYWCMIVPHTSGVNRWWNEPANVELARRELTTLVHGLRKGLEALDKQAPRV